MRFVADGAHSLRAGGRYFLKKQAENKTSQDVISLPSAPADRGLMFQWYGADPLPGDVLPRLITLSAVRPGFNGEDCQKIAFDDEEANALIGTDNTPESKESDGYAETVTRYHFPVLPALSEPTAPARGSA